MDSFWNRNPFRATGTPAPDRSSSRQSNRPPQNRQGASTPLPNSAYPAPIPRRDLVRSPTPSRSIPIPRARPSFGLPTSPPEEGPLLVPQYQHQPQYQPLYPQQQHQQRRRNSNDLWFHSLLQREGVAEPWRPDVDITPVFRRAHHSAAALSLLHSHVDQLRRDWSLFGSPRGGRGDWPGSSALPLDSSLDLAGLTAVCTMDAAKWDEPIYSNNPLADYGRPSPPRGSPLKNEYAYVADLVRSFVGELQADPDASGYSPACYYPNTVPAGPPAVALHKTIMYALAGLRILFVERQLHNAQVDTAHRIRLVLEHIRWSLEFRFTGHPYVSFFRPEQFTAEDPVAHQMARRLFDIIITSGHYFGGNHKVWSTLIALHWFTVASGSLEFIVTQMAESQQYDPRLIQRISDTFKKGYFFDHVN